MIRRSTLRSDLPSCQSDLSGESTKDKDGTCTEGQGHGKKPTALLPDEGLEQRPGLGPTSPELHALSNLPEPGMEKTILGSVNQSSDMEHNLRWDEVQLLEVYNKTEPEVTVESEVTSAGCLVGTCLSMENVIDVWVHQTSLQVQVCCWRS